MIVPDSTRRRGFTLAEVCVALVVCVVFGAGAFVTNQRLLFAIKSQKETTAAAMVMQQRMEQLRASGFSQVANASYLRDVVIANATGSEAPLGNLTETITVSAYDPTTGSALAGFTPAVVQRTSATPGGTIVSAGNLPGIASLLRVDVLLNWRSVNARLRTRQISSIVTVGNIAP